MQPFTLQIYLLSILISAALFALSLHDDPCQRVIMLCKVSQLAKHNLVGTGPKNHILLKGKLMIRNPYMNALLDINYEGESGNSAVHSKCELWKTQMWDCWGSYFDILRNLFLIFTVLVSVRVALHVVFLERGFFSYKLQKASIYGLQFAQPLLTVCRSEICQFAAQNFGSLLIMRSALCTERNDADVFVRGWVPDLRHKGPEHTAELSV